MLAAALVLIGVGFGVFYAIRNSNNPAAVSAPTSQPSPTAEAQEADADIDPATGGSTDDKSAEAIEKSVDATIKKNEKAVKDKAPERANVSGET